jgi:glucose-specific phosphotransferase system IIA component
MPRSVGAPVPGRAVPLSDVPDPVFAQAMVGPGAAVDPPRRVIDAASPIDGTLVKVHPHAFVVRADDGLAVLVHLGIDTVKLDGAPFTVRAGTGARVAAGDVVTTWDVAAVESAGLSPVVPVIALEQAADAVTLAGVVTGAGGGEVNSGETLFTVGSPAPG